MKVPGANAFQAPKTEILAKIMGCVKNCGESPQGAWAQTVVKPLPIRSWEAAKQCRELRDMNIIH